MEGTDPARLADVSKYLSEMRKEALAVLFPNPTEQDERMSLITTFRGRPPDLYTLYLAAVEWEGWTALVEKRQMDWSKLNPADFLKSHSPSIQGKRASQAVEIARATPTPERRRGLVDRLLGQ